MKFKTTHRGGVTVIALQGSLMGGPDAADLHGRIQGLVEQGKTNVVLDLGGVEFMNSSGLSLLIGAAGAVRNAGGALRLASVPAKILALIKITKLGPVFETFPTVAKAVASFTR